MINYEDIFLEDIKDILSNKFYIKDEKALFIYLYIRFLIIENYKGAKIKIKNVSINDKFIDFIIKETCISNSKNEIIYKGVSFKKNFGAFNNIKNALESWYFDISIIDLLLPTGENINVSKYIIREYNEFISSSKSKMKKYKKNKIYKYYYLDFSLTNLNNKFNVCIVNEPKMKINFLYDESYYKNCLPYETICKRMISCDNINNGIYTISEYDLENFLIRNIESIEEGLTYIKRQVDLKNGRIDILAKDNKGNYVIIELKIKSNDKRIIWQSIHYKAELEAMLNKNNIRVITLAPDYDESILFDLKKLGFVDIYKFKLHFMDKEIDKIDIYKA